MPQIPSTALPKFVNRGPAGLLAKRPEWAPPLEDKHKELPVADAPINNIAPALKSLIVPIDSLTPDPDNAREHPEKNLLAIGRSLKLYGQVKPVVVRKDKMIVVAGNGTLHVAKSLGWTEIAASIVEMNDVEAAGYGLADNRTAELAKWDIATVARLDALLNEAGHASVGWSPHELEVLRSTTDTWVPPKIDDEAKFGEDNKAKGGIDLKFDPSQVAIIVQAIDKLKSITEEKLTYEQAIEQICYSWLYNFQSAIEGE